MTPSVNVKVATIALRLLCTTPVTPVVHNAFVVNLNGLSCQGGAAATAGVTMKIA